MQSEKIKNKLPYPKNLVEDIMGVGIEDDKLCVAELPVSIEYILMTLTERERYIIKKRYQAMMTYRKIGEEFELGPESVRQIIEKAMRKLKHPSRSNFLVYGITGEIARREQTSFERGYIDGSKRLKSSREIIENASVDELDLSIHTYACLMQNRIKTIKELTSFSYSDLHKMRGMGKKKLDEIVDKLREFGIELKEE